MGDQGDRAAHSAVDAHVRGSECLEHQAAGDDAHQDGHGHPYVDDDRVASDPDIRACGHRLQKYKLFRIFVCYAPSERRHRLHEQTGSPVSVPGRNPCPYGRLL